MFLCPFCSLNFEELGDIQQHLFNCVYEHSHLCLSIPPWLLIEQEVFTQKEEEREGEGNEERKIDKGKEVVDENIIEKECVVCLFEEECVTLSCGHPICLPMFLQHLETLMDENRTLVCPSSECERELDIFMYTELFDKGFNDKLDAYLLRKMLERTAKPCPTKDCPNQFIIEDNINNVYCDVCSNTFCTQCMEHFHYGVTCDEYKLKKAEWKDFKSEGKIPGTPSAKEQFIADEVWKMRNCRICPNCGNLIEKISGCSHIRCGGDPYLIQGKVTNTDNKQKGCGHGFIWERAKPYISTISNEEKQKEMNKINKNYASEKIRTSDEIRTMYTGLNYNSFVCIDNVFYLRYNLSALTVPHLINILRTMKLKVRGRKDELLARINDELKRGKFRISNNNLSYEAFYASYKVFNPDNQLKEENKEKKVYENQVCNWCLNRAAKYKCLNCEHFFSCVDCEKEISKGIHKHIFMFIENKVTPNK